MCTGVFLRSIAHYDNVAILLRTLQYFVIWVETSPGATTYGFVKRNFDIASDWSVCLSYKQEMGEPKPGPSFLSSPVKKRPKSTLLTENEKTIALNIYKYVEKTITTYPYKTEIAKTTAEIMGVSQSTIYAILREYKKTGVVVSPPQHRPPHRSVIENLDTFILSAIRRKVHQFYFNNEVPTLDKIVTAVNDDEDLPSFSRMTMYRILKKLNFQREKRSRKSILLDRPDLMIWRKQYLLQIEDFRKENRKIYYLDETWVNEGHCVDYIWVDKDIQSSRQAFLRGLSTGLKNPQKGKRLIVTHIGSEDGFLEGGLWVFEAKKSDGDYHGEMDAYNFEKWFQKILDLVEPGSIIVMDNAPYHSRRIEQVPNMAWRKDKIQSWLREKGIEYDQNDIKAQLLQRINKNAYKKKVVDDMAEKKNIKVLRLPPYHCELNPIEMIWAQVKSHVGRNNKTFKMSEVKTLLEEGIAKVSAAQWTGCIKHVIKEEKNMMALEGLIDAATDAITEKFIINVGDYTTTDDDSDIEDFLPDVSL